MATTKVKLNQLELSTTPGSLLTSNASNIPSFLAPATGTNHIAYYKDSVTGWVNLAIGTNLSIDTGTNTLNASAGAGGYATIQEEGSTVGSGNTTINFIGSGITAANAGGGVTSITLDATLNALASYNTNGFLVQTSADTFTGRSLVAPAAGFTITNNDAVSGNPTFVLANDLAALEALASTGIAVRTGSDTWAQRTITGTANRIVVTNGDGVSGNPTLDVGTNIAVLNENETVSASWTFSNNITLNGTPSAGTDVTNVTFVNTAIANAIAGLRKGSVRAATTTAGTLGTSFANGQVIDGVTLATGNLILIKNQSSAAENGVYTVNASGAPTRATWMDAASEIDGVYVAVEDGTTLAGTLWITVSEVTTLGTDPITFTQIQTSGTIDGSGATNKVAFWSDADTLTSDTNFHYASNQLAIGVSAPVTNTVITTRGFTVGSTSNYAFHHTNSAGSRRAAISDAGQLTLENSIADTVIIDPNGLTASGSYNISMNATGSSSALTLYSAAADFDAILLKSGTNTAAGIHISTDRTVSGKILTVSPQSNLTATSGTFTNTEFLSTFAPTSGTATHAGVKLSETINQTGGANGITRGLWISPTLTAAADYRGLEITSSASHYALYSTAGKVRFDLGSDANWDLPVRSATGELTRIANGTTGQVLTATTGSAPSWQSVSAGTFTVGYVTGTGTDTYDLDAGTVVKDVDGAGFSFTVPADLNKTIIYRNGVLLSRSGTVTRDYTLNSGTGVLVLASTLATDETLTIYKIV